MQEYSHRGGAHLSTVDAMKLLSQASRPGSSVTSPPNTSRSKLHRIFPFISFDAQDSPNGGKCIAASLATALSSCLSQSEAGGARQYLAALQSGRDWGCIGTSTMEEQPGSEGTDLNSGICTSENWAAPTMGILFMSGVSVTRNLPLMMSLCMQTCTPADNSSPCMPLP